MAIKTEFKYYGALQEKIRQRDDKENWRRSLGLQAKVFYLIRNFIVNVFLGSKIIEFL